MWWGRRGLRVAAAPPSLHIPSEGDGEDEDEMTYTQRERNQLWYVHRLESVQTLIIKESRNRE